MQNPLLSFKKTGIALIVFMLASSNIFGAVFTATQSGGWNVGATWGGTAPSSNLTTDQVIIPATFTVTLDSDLSINGALASVTVEGTLSGASDTLSLGLGTLTGTGSINVSGLVLNTGAALAFTGTIVANTVTNFAVGLQSSANFTVNQTLTLAGGAFVQAAGTLTLTSGSNIMLTGGLLSTSGGILSLTSSYNVTYLQGSAVAGFELSGAGLNNLTINVPSYDSVALGANVAVNGALSLANGTLSLNGNNFTINGNIVAGGSGTISSSITSKISVSTGTSPSGALQFSTSGDTVGELSINISGSNGTVNVNSDIVVSASLNLITGTLNIGTHTLKVAALGVITGAGSASYVIAATGGSLNLQATAAAVTWTTFPVGTIDHYAPVAVQLNTGSASGGINVSVSDGIDAEGTTGSNLALTQQAVNVTYYVEPDSITNTSLNLELMWSSVMEVNGFTNDSAYISHFTAGAWDTSAITTATFSGGLYTATRANITSFSPFAVFGPNAITTGVAQINSNPNFTIYPNPAYDNLVVNVATGNDKVYMDIIALNGQILDTYELTNNSTNIPLQQLSAGTYFVKLYSNTMNEVKKFVKM